MTIALLGLAIAPGSTQAARLRFSFVFGDRTPGTPTSGRVHVVFPTDPRGRPKQLRGLDFRFPVGTRIDRSVAPKCAATDA